MQNFLLITGAGGEARIIPVSDLTNIKVGPGDDVVVMDHAGKPVQVSMRPDGNDLVIKFESDATAILEDFYALSGEGAPITVSLNPVEPIADNLNFDAESGNLPELQAFSLMRFSNLDHVEFVDQLSNWDRSLLANGGTGSSGNGRIGAGRGSDPAFLPTGQIEESNGSTEVSSGLFPPAAISDSGFGVDGGQPIEINLLSNDLDPLGGGLSLLGIGGIAMGIGETVTLASGTKVTMGPGGMATVRPGKVFESLNEGESGIESFAYTIGDANGRVDSGEVTITVVGVNNPPEARPDEIRQNEDASITIDVLENDSDPDQADTLTVTAVSSPPAGIVSINPDNTITFDPDDSYGDLSVGETRTVTLTYSVVDSSGLSSTSTVSFVVEGRNDAPEAHNDTRTTLQNSTLTIDALTNDLDPDSNDTLVITGAQQPDKGSVSLDENNRLVFDPGTDFVSLDKGVSEEISFDYFIADGNGGTSAATITVTVTGVEDPAEVRPDSSVTNESELVVIDVLENDTDPDSGEVLEIDQVSTPAKGNVSTNGTTVTFDPGTDFEGLAAGEFELVTFDYTLTSGEVGTVTVTVNGLNNSPVAILDSADVLEDASVDVPVINGVLQNDADLDLSDDLVVTGVRSGPETGSGTSIAPGSAIVGQFGTLVLNVDGSYTYAADGDAADPLAVGATATDVFTYTLSDGNGGSATASLTITINGADDETATISDTGITDEETSIFIDVLSNDTDVDQNDTLTIDSVMQPDDPDDGVVVVSGNGVSFTPGANFNSLAVGETGTTTFSYVAVAAGSGEASTETVTVTINGVNDDPTANNDSTSTDQNSVVSLDLLGAADSVSADSDPDGDSLTVSTINGLVAGGTITLASGALLTVNGDGTVDYDPNGQFDSLDAGVTAVDTFDYEVSDGKGGTSSATGTVTINGIDDPIIMNPDTGTTFEGTPISLDVLANDSDADDTLSIESFGQPADPDDGVVAQVGDSLTFTPGANFENLGVGESAVTSFSYTVEADGSGELRTETVTVTVNGLNDDPNANDDMLVSGENEQVVIDVLGNDSDPDSSDTLTVTSATNPIVGPGDVEVSSGGTTITFDPGTEFDGLAEGETSVVVFNYEMSDEHGGADIATVRLTLTGENDAPILVSDSGQTDEDSVVEIDVLADDSDLDRGDTLTLSGVSDPLSGNGSARISDDGTKIIFDPGTSFNSLAVGESELVTFNYEVSDSLGATSISTVTVTVTGVNDGPAASNDEGSLTENATTEIELLINDSDPDASDELTVTAVNDPPADKGSVSLSGNVVTFDPGSDFDDLAVGEDEEVSFTYEISDGRGGTDTASVTVTVTGTNDGPVATNDVGGTTENATTSIAVLGNDSDVDASDELTVTAVNDPPTDKGSVSLSGNIITFDPGSDFEALAVGEDEEVIFTYEISDGKGGTDTASVTVTVTGTNDGPVATNDVGSTTENATTTITVLSNDSDLDAGDELTVTAVNDPPADKGSVSLSGNVVTFDPGSDFDDLAVGEDEEVTFTYEISDGKGGTDTASVTVTVTGTNDGPVATNDVGSTTENATTTITVLSNDTDVDASDELTVTAVNDAPSDKGSVSLSGNVITFDPGSDFDDLAVGEDEEVIFTYEISDGKGGTDTASVTITVTGTNDGPVATNDVGSTRENATTTITVLSNDTDVDSSDELTVTAVNDPPADKGSVSLSGNIITFDPGSDFEALAVGEDEEVSFTYEISDGRGGTDTASVTVTVTGTNDGPVATNDVGSTTENVTTTVDLLGNDSDPDTGDELTVITVNDPPLSKGSVTLIGNSAVFDPGTDFDNLAVGETEEVTFTYEISDGNGGTDTASVTVTVTGTNDGPVAVNDLGSTTENSTTAITVLENDADSDSSDVLTVTAVNDPPADKGSVRLSNNVITFDPETDFDNLAVGETEEVMFSYDIGDGKGGTDTATVTVTVTGTNDGPVASNDAGSTTENSTTTISVLANDSDLDTSDELTVTAVNDPPADKGSVSLSDNVITFDPGNDFDNLGVGEMEEVTFSYDISDGKGGSDTASVSITVTGTNDGPIATNDSGSTTGNAMTTIDLLENDSDLDTTDVLTLTAVNDPPPGKGTVTQTANSAIFDPETDFDYLGVGEMEEITFTYEISDGKGGTDTASATVTVTGTNDGPVATNDVGSTTENATTTITVLSNDADVDAGDELTVTAVNDPPADKGSVSLSGNVVTFDPGSDFDDLAVGEDEEVTFTYEISDGNGGADTASVTVTVTGTNDGPVATNDVGSTTENATTTITVLGNDSDLDAGDELTVTAVNDPPADKGSVSLSGNVVTFDPGSDFDDLAVGEDEEVTFTYEISDGKGGTDTASVTVTVTGTNDGPVAANDVGSTAENATTTITVLSNDTDVDASDELTVTAVNDPPVDKGSVSLSGNIITFDPGTDFEALAVGDVEEVTFTYEISDGKGGTDTASVTVTVTGTNDGPVATNDVGSTTENATTTITVLSNDSDVDAGDELTVTAVNDPPIDKGSVSLSGNVVTFDPGSDFDELAVGEDEEVTFTYEISDGKGGTDTASVTVTVTGTNDGPVATNDVGSTTENATTTITVLSNDTDVDAGDELTVTAVNDPPTDKGSVSLSGNAITFDPGSDFDDLAVGEDEEVSFTYEISDGNGGVDTASVIVTVTGTNDGPVATNDVGSTTENATTTINLLANDSDPDTTDSLTVTGVNDPPVGKGSILQSGNSVIFDPGSDFDRLAVNETEEVTFTYELTDGNGGTDTASVTVTVMGTNDGPVAGNDVGSTTENATTTITVLANDSDPDLSDTLTVTAVDSPPSGKGSVSLSGNSIIFDPGADFEGLADGEKEEVTFNYDMSDGNGGTDSASVTVTITGTNDGPVATNDFGSTTENATTTLNLITNDSDPDSGDVLTVMTVNDPPAGKGSVTQSGNEVTFDPGTDFDSLALNEIEEVTFTYIVSDGDGSTDTASVTITVLGTNDGPVALDDFAGINENATTAITVLVNDTDPDTGDQLTVTSVDDPPSGKGSASLSGNVITFDPGTDFDSLAVDVTELVTFDYAITDGKGGSDSASITITVTGTNDGPVAVDDSGSTTEDATTTIALLPNDSDLDSSDTLTVVAVNDPPVGKGSVSQTGNSVVFDPGTDFESLAVGQTEEVTFTYVVSDGHSGSDIGSVTVTVTGTNDGPTAVEESVTTTETETIDIDLLANDSDPDSGDVLTVTSVDDPPVGKGSISQSGNSITFDPGNDFEGLGANESEEVTFSYEISDGNGGTDTASITVTVTGVNSAPEANGDSAETGEHGVVTIPVLENDTDPDTNDTLTVTGVDSPTGGGSTAVVNGGQAILFNPGTSFNYLSKGETETVTFDYYISDGEGGTDTATVTVTVTGTNDAPGALNDNAITEENAALFIDVIDNDIEIDLADTLTVTQVNFAQPNSGSVSISNDGSGVNFDPGSDFDDLSVGQSRVISFTYRVEDDEGAFDSAMASVTVTGTNDGPVAVADGADTEQSEVVVIDVLSNDTDPDSNDALTVTAVNSPPIGKGSTSLDDNSVTFDPGSDFDGLAYGETEEVSFTYEISDGNGGTDTGSVTVTVTGTNDDPVASNDLSSTSENRTTVIDVLANDTDTDVTDVLTVTAVNSLPFGKGSASLSNDLITFDPGSDFDDLAVDETETVTFTYDIEDGNGGTDTGSVTVTVTGTNDGPVATNDSTGTTENASTTIALLSNDSDVDGSDILTVTQVNDAPSGKGSVTQSGNTAVFNPGSDFDTLAFGETELVSFDYEIEDGNGGSDTATVTVTVTGTNDGPIAAGDTGNTSENATTTITVLANDSDPDTSDVLTVTAVNDPPSGKGSTSLSGNEITFNPGNDFDRLGLNETEEVIFTYDISDGNGGTATASVTVTVTGTNDGPVATNDVSTTGEDATTTINLVANDSDPDTSDSFTVTSVDDPPAGKGSITKTGNSITFDPGTDFNSLAVDETEVVTFDYEIEDENGATDTASVTITVTGSNDGPYAASDGRITSENSGTTIAVLDNDTDPDTSDTLTVTGISQPPSGKGTASLLGGAVTFDPGSDFDHLAAGDSEMVSFTYSISDGNGGTSTASVNVLVTGVNDAPVAAVDSVSYIENSGSLVGSNLLLNDTDSDDGSSATITSVNGNSGNVGSPISTTYGDFTINSNGTTAFVENTAINGLNAGQTVVETFTYVVTDDKGATDSATVSLTLTGTNDGPTLVSSIADVEVPDAPVTSNAAPASGSDATTQDVDDITVNQIAQSLIGDGVTFVGASLTSGTNDQAGTIEGMLTAMPGVSGFDDGVVLSTGSVESINGPNSSDRLSIFAQNGEATNDSDDATVDVDLGTVFDLTILRIEFIPTGNFIAGNYIFGSEEYNEWVNSGFNDNMGIVVNGTNFALTPDGEVVGINTINNGENSSLFVDNDIQDTGAPYHTEMDGFTETLQFKASVNPGVVNVLELKIGDVGDNQYESWLLFQSGSLQSNGVEVDLEAYFDDVDFEDDPESLTYTAELTNGDPLPAWLTLSDNLLTGFAPIDGSVDLEIQVTATDLQGASTSTSFNIQSSGNVAPIVIDLDGDGAEFDVRGQGINFDLNGDGVLETVAWADEDDAVLIYDGNGNGLVDDRSEFAFAELVNTPGATDLDGLRHFDSNEDLILDANDDEFGSFRLWQDADGDGEVGEGEMMTLTEAGIESLELVSDGVGYSAANGDVQVHGEAGVNFADGSTGVLADASFDFDEFSGADDSLEIITESGEVLDLNNASIELEPATPDILEGAASDHSGVGTDRAEEGGAVSPTSIDDDMAAADAAMS